MPSRDSNDEAEFLGEAPARVPIIEPISLTGAVNQAVNQSRTTRVRMLPPNVFSGFDYAYSELPNHPQPPNNPRNIRLLDATHTILNEYQVSRPESDNDGRESNYESMLRNEKRQSVTYMDLLTSDMPVYVGGIDVEKYRELCVSHACGEIWGSDEEGYTLRCRKCGEVTPSSYAFLLNGNAYCAEHVPNLKLCSTCNNLRDNTRLINTYDGREVNVCERCIANRLQRGCAVCAQRIPDANIQIQRCDNHIDDDGESTSRSFSKGLKWVNTEKGDIFKSKRMFSAEIEALVKRGSLIELVARAIPRECGVGYDGSVQGPNLAGFEMQTPRLGGKKGEELVYRVAAELKKVEATVNDTCGLHVHLDGRGLISADRKEHPTSLIQLWKTYLVFEDVILSLIPYNRRFSTYSRPLRDAFKIVELDTCDTILDLERLWYKERNWQNIQSVKSQHHHSSRYFGVNLHPLLGHGHMEIRYHSGTTNANKILQWANLHALIMDAAVAKKFTKDFLKEGQHTSSLKEKSQLLFEKIGMNEGSKQYFYGRQKKFTRKTNNESHVA